MELVWCPSKHVATKNVEFCGAGPALLRRWTGCLLDNDYDSGHDGWKFRSTAVLLYDLPILYIKYGKKIWLDEIFGLQTKLLKIGGELDVDRFAHKSCKLCAARPVVPLPIYERGIMTLTDWRPKKVELIRKRERNRHPCSKAYLQHYQAVIQPCMWFLHDGTG